MQQINTITQLLRNGTNFANIVYATEVKTAAKYKGVNIRKETQANVQLFNKVNDFNVYANAVKRSAANKLAAHNDKNDVEQFTAQSNYFEHTDCYSIVKHKTKDVYYLYAIFNSAKSNYYIDGLLATKAEVAQFLTASAAKKLLEDNSIVHNKANDVLHTVHVRTIALGNIKSITANKQTIVF